MLLKQGNTAEPAGVKAGRIPRETASPCCTVENENGGLAHVPPSIVVDFLC